MMRLAWLFAMIAGAGLAQTAPPPVLVSTLPPNVSQKILITGTAKCSNSNLNLCRQQYAGANWYAASQGGSGGYHYDAAGNLLIMTPLGGGDSSSIIMLAPDGTVHGLLSNAPPPITCAITSVSSAQIGYSYMLPSFSINPVSNILYVVTANFEGVYTWDPSTTSASNCLNGNPQISGPYNLYYLVTFTTLAMTGAGI